VIRLCRHNIYELIQMARRQMFQLLVRTIDADRGAL
jgi:hypothetical protein